MITYRYRILVLMTIIAAGLLLAAGSVAAEPAPQTAPAVGLPAERGAAGLASTVELTNTLHFPVVARFAPLYNIFGATLESVSSGGGLPQLAATGSAFTRGPFLAWNLVEPAAPGVRDWSPMAGLEAQLAAASAQGIDVILVVGYTPTWAQARPGSSCGPIREDKLDAFADFMAAAVARYSAPPYNVKYWELWNEPDIDLAENPALPPDNPFGCWGDRNDPYYGGRYYGTMLNRIYPRIKAVQPAAQVLVGGLLLDCDPNNPPAGKSCLPAKFIDGILIATGGRSFDGISFHAYDYCWPGLGQYGNSNWNSYSHTTGPVTRIKAAYVRNRLAAYQVTGKYLMNTEAAVLCDTPTNEAEWEQTKAYYVAQVYATALADGYRANVWYSMYGWRDPHRDRHTALLYADGSPRPAYTAYSVAAQQLSRAVFSRALNQYPGVLGYEFHQEVGRVWVLWSRDGSAHTIALPAAPASVSDIFGSMRTPSSTLVVGLDPIYVQWRP